jgi:drug/metabolite transporter (DMT)-like permease
MRLRDSVMDKLRGENTQENTPVSLQKRRAARLQIIVIILIATVSVAIGETLLSAGMKEVHKVDAQGFGYALATVGNWKFLLGTCFMCLYFGLYSYCLSIADISFVLPFTAMSYLFVAALARFFLHEDVSPTRWLGAIIIVIGVIVVGLGERRG